MHRRAYLAAFATAAVAGCTTQSDGGGDPATDTSTPEATPTPTPEPTPTPTPEPTETETPTPTETETPTPEPTPTDFERAIADARAGLSVMLDAYLSQGDGADTLVDVGGDVSFTYSDLSDGNKEAGDAHLDARDEAETGQQNNLVDQLDAVRQFLWQSAQAQQRWSTAFDAVVECRHDIEDEELDAWDRLEHRGTIRTEYIAVRTSFRQAEEASDPEDVEAFDAISTDEYEAKLDQLENAVDDLSALHSALGDVQEGLAEMEQGHNETAAELLGDAHESIEALLRNGVDASMELEIEGIADAVFQKETKAEANT